MVKISHVAEAGQEMHSNARMHRMQWQENALIDVTVTREVKSIADNHTHIQGNISADLEGSHVLTVKHCFSQCVKPR